ncbi:Hypp9573 [Branchiostoma lanceolatum]|uniref:Hypp9573 protein n=1 Tax=Branchiostoma lanceolatum TaxID=7740 RepID=A0A8S4MN42_BRALA|nr:Hypp9573 [Branchiostoma lanceolatum]
MKYSLAPLEQVCTSALLGQWPKGDPCMKSCCAANHGSPLFPGIQEDACGIVFSSPLSPGLSRGQHIRAAASLRVLRIPTPSSGEVFPSHAGERQLHLVLILPLLPFSPGHRELAKPRESN